MKQRLLFLLKLAGFFLFYFFISRLYFQLYQFGDTQAVAFSELLLTYVHGIRLDLSLTGYILLLISLLTVLSAFMGKLWFGRVIHVLVFFFLALFSIIVIVDAELYQYWGFRMDTSPLVYLDNPKLAMASTPLFKIVLLMVGWAFYSLFFAWIYLKWIASAIQNFQPIKWYLTPVFIVVSASMILPIRGSLGIAPINTGMVYFSSHMYVNHATLNVVWNFFYDVTHTDRTHFTVNYMPSEKASEIRESLISNKSGATKVLSSNRPNVLFIILEGFSGAAIEAMGGEPGVTPYLNKYWNEGVAFSNIYATGMRSDRGLVAVLSGYPSHPRASVMKYPQKTQQIPSVTSALKQQNYQTTYYYGGDVNFANMRSYLLNSGFDRIVSQDMFPKEYMNSKWGVHDEHMFKYLMNDIDSASQPFFKACFTLSSHEPFDVPMETVIEGNDPSSMYLNSIVYADRCLGEFINEAKTKAWWRNTLVVLIADHSVRYPSSLELTDPERYMIPMLWMGGAVSDTAVVDRYGNQYDLAASLLNQMDLPADEFVFSNNLLENSGEEHAMFIYNHGFGMLSDSGSLSYDFNQEEFVKIKGDTTGMPLKSKGLFQSMIEHFNGL